MTFHYWDVELFALMTHSLEIAKDSPLIMDRKKVFCSLPILKFPWFY